MMCTLVTATTEVCDSEFMCVGIVINPEPSNRPHLHWVGRYPRRLSREAAWRAAFVQRSFER